MALVVTSNEYKNQQGELLELHAVKRWFNVTTEGPSEFFFDHPAPLEQRNGPQTQNVNTNVHDSHENAIPDDIDDILRNVGVVGLPAGFEEMIDDDNEPAPENVPNTDDNHESALKSWGHSGICFRKAAGEVNSNARLNYPREADTTALNIFLLMFPKAYLKDVVLVQTNLHLKDQATFEELL